jgi:excisionase family DNA binding protein
MSSEIMTIQELAKYLDLAEGTLYKKVSNNEIPYAKLGNLLRFPKWAIDQWVSENTVKPPDALFNEFAKLQSRYHFKKWLESKGIDPTGLTWSRRLLPIFQAIIPRLKNENRKNKPARVWNRAFPVKSGRNSKEAWHKAL